MAMASTLLTATSSVVSPIPGSMTASRRRRARRPDRSSGAARRTAPPVAVNSVLRVPTRPGGVRHSGRALPTRSFNFRSIFVQYLGRTRSRGATRPS